MADDTKPTPPAAPAADKAQAAKPAAAPAPQPYRVRAVTRGFYGMLREPGVIFDVAKDEDLGAWMDPIDAKDRERLKGRIEAALARRPFIPADRTKVPPTTGPGYKPERG